MNKKCFATNNTNASQLVQEGFHFQVKYISIKKAFELQPTEITLPKKIEITLRHISYQFAEKKCFKQFKGCARSYINSRTLHTKEIRTADRICKLPKKNSSWTPGVNYISKIVVDFSLPIFQLEKTINCKSARMFPYENPPLLYQAYVFLPWMHAIFVKS